MISVRRGVFETNSSSTHSLTMCSEDEYNKWKKGELLFHRWDEEFKKKEEIEDLDEWYTYDEYWDSIDLETYKNEYTTESGEKIIAFGYYGFDG